MAASWGLPAHGRAASRAYGGLAILAACLYAGAPVPLYALQCPDGTPPPCVQRARAPARIAPPPPAQRARQFVVIPFRNLSRSPELDWLIEGSTTLLSDVLGRWQELTVVPDERLSPALRRAGITPGAVAELPALRRIAEETGGWTAITGEMLMTGGRVVVRARALDVVTGRELARGSAESSAGDDVRGAFGRAGSQLLRAAGLESPNLDVAAGTTGSLDAYRAYARGLTLRNRNQFGQAREAFLEALRHDSAFAQAWFSLAGVLLFNGPAAAFDDESEMKRAITRAVALADRLPPRQRDLILAVGAMFRGQFGGGRDVLERLVAADSSDDNAVGWLAFLEWVDHVLVAGEDGTPRRRGSLNRSVRLARGLLEMEPDAHGPYIPIVYTYLLAAGDLPAILPVWSREMPFDQLLFSPPAGIYAPLLRDSIELVRIDEFLRLPPESLQASRRRAAEAARLWVSRWLVAGPREGAAHQAAARVSEVSGEYDAALGQLAVADSLGIEIGILDPRGQRLSVLARGGRYSAAYSLADSLWKARRLRSLTPIPNDQFDALRLSFNLFVMRGDFARADSLVQGFGRTMQRLVPGGTGVAARQTALSLASGRVLLPLYIVGLTLGLRLDALDSASTRMGAQAAESPARELLNTLARWAAEDARGNPALEARVRAAPWYRP